jgi:hypothetical protein
VLRDPTQLQPLLDVVSQADRLVLLGDVIELRHGPLRDALAAARPVLMGLAQALPAGAEVLIVPGNHDHHLLSAWFERRERNGTPGRLGAESQVDWQAGDTLEAVAGWLGEERVRVRYPGVWLRDDVYAMHGHYLDRHTTVPMFERLGAGAMARVVREPAAGPRGSDDYERVLAPIYAWIHALAQRGGPEYGASSHGASAQAWRALAAEGRRNWRRRALMAAFPAIVAALNRAGVGPVTTDISGPELRRAALRAFGEVLRRLDVRAEHVVFGHTHRAGPVPDDDPSEWDGLINCGSWVHEPHFLGSRPERSPYRAGFGVWVEDQGPPKLTNLLSSPVPA